MDIIKNIYHKIFSSNKKIQHKQLHLYNTQQITCIMNNCSFIDNVYICDTNKFYECSKSQN